MDWKPRDFKADPSAEDPNILLISWMTPSAVEFNPNLRFQYKVWTWTENDDREENFDAEVYCGEDLKCTLHLPPGCNRNAPIKIEIVAFRDNSPSDNYVYQRGEVQFSWPEPE